VLAAALLLAALVNADALVDRAERKPLGAGRDRALAFWHPVQDVSHVLQLHRIRDLGDALVNDDRRPAGVTPPPISSPTDERAVPTVTVPPRPELRAPTPADPLRVWVGGDSMMRDLSESIERAAATNALLAVTTQYEISSGLARPDYYDWPAALAADMAATAAEVVVIMFGANDGQGIVGADGTVYQRVSEPGWQREYAGRVAAVMDQLQASGRLVLWVGQPPMRDGDFDARIRILDEIYRTAAASRPWIDFVDTAPLFAGPDGGFADRVPDPGGGLEDLRQDDGIHFSRGGADKLADHLLALIADEIATPAATATTSTTAPTVGSDG